MRPKTTVRFDARSFADLARTVRVRSETRRLLESDPSGATPLPLEVSLQLTYRCNLRCDHCYQWNEQGFFRAYDAERQRAELDLEIAARVLAETEEVRAKLFLWGGEPLMYSRFPELAALLEDTPRTVNLCTNGLLMKERAADLFRIGRGLNVLVSVDGPEEAHDALRGRGTFVRTAAAVEWLLEARRRGDFRGEVTLLSMVADGTAGRLYETAEWAERLGVSSLYFQLPWYISPQTAAAMDARYAAELAWLNPPPAPGRATWHSYSYRLSEDVLPALARERARVAARAWSIRLRYQPEVSDGELADFARGTDRPAQGKSRCLAVSNRMEVHADGNVSSCKFFPEFVVGSLRGAPVREVWQSARFRRVREVVQRGGLFPVCSRCILLYLNGDESRTGGTAIAG